MQFSRVNVPFPVLIGDIGGTNARFAVIEDRDSALTVFPSVATADFPDIESAVVKSVLAHTELRPRAAIIDLAGPIVGDAVDLTNAHWVVRPRNMIGRLSVEDAVLLNDFEALALSLTSLDNKALVPIGKAAGGSGAKVVLGPGTGLGVGALVDAGGVWIPVPGEGGHVALGPANPDEFPLWTNIEPEHGRVSAEALLSGRGLVRLYRAVAATEAREVQFSTPADITRAALSSSTDPVASRTVMLYCRLLGRLAGDVALTFMARGGVYIAGGIAPRILPVLLGGEFRRAFEAKAPHQELMAKIATSVIVSENPALQGLATFARSPDFFGVNLSGRRWLK
jgi:glucokinase